MENYLADRIKTILADQLGAEIDDIKEEDSLVDDLSMTPSDLADLSVSFEKEGLDTEKLDFSEILTVSDLLEAFNAEI